MARPLRKGFIRNHVVNDRHTSPMKPQSTGLLTQADCAPTSNTVCRRPPTRRQGAQAGGRTAGGDSSWSRVGPSVVALPEGRGSRGGRGETVARPGNPRRLRSGGRCRGCWGGGGGAAVGGSVAADARGTGPGCGLRHQGRPLVAGGTFSTRSGLREPDAGVSPYGGLSFQAARTEGSRRTVVARSRGVHCCPLNPDPDTRRDFTGITDVKPTGCDCS